MASSTDPLSGLKNATPGGGAVSGVASPNPGGSAQSLFQASGGKIASATQTGQVAPAPAGGALAGNAPPDSSALATDPTYLAYMRSIGLSNANDQASAQAGINAQNRSLAVTIPELQTSDAFASQNAIGRLEARGVLEGGGAANEMGQLANTQQTRINSDEAGTATKVAAINQTLQTQLLANQAKLAEQGLTATGKVGLNMGENQVAQSVNNQAAAQGVTPTVAAPVAA